MLFFGVDRFAEFLIFQKNKVFFFFGPSWSPGLTLYIPRPLYLSTPPAHGYLLLGAITRQNPSLSILKKQVYIGLWPLYNPLKRELQTLNRVLQVLIGVPRGAYPPKKGGLPSSQGSFREKVPKRPLKRHISPLRGYQLALYTLLRG